ncbi:hypothetical protein HK405_008551, partial [Cladochytrium tenue]
MAAVVPLLDSDDAAPTADRGAAELTSGADFGRRPATATLISPLDDGRRSFTTDVDAIHTSQGIEGWQGGRDTSDSRVDARGIEAEAPEDVEEDNDDDDYED